MGITISVRLDDEVRRELETQAHERGIGGLATLLRELAADAARDARRARIRKQSAVVAEYVRSSPEARTFYDDWGTPDWGILSDD